MENHRPTTQRKLQPPGPNNGCIIIQQHIDTRTTRMIGTSPINRPSEPQSLPDNPKCHTSNTQHVNHPSPTSLQPSHPRSYHRLSKFPNQTQPVPHNQIIPSENQPNQPNPPNNLRSPTATTETLKTKPPSIKAIRPSPSPLSPYPNQTLDPVINMPAQKRSHQDQCNQTIQPTQSPSPHDAPKPTNSSMLTYLRNELMHTRNLLDRLSSTIAPKLNVPLRTTSKTLFELINDLPLNDPLLLLTTPSHTAYLKKYSATQPTCTYWIPPNHTIHAKTRIIPYLSMILLWSMLQFTVQYSKDLLKVP